MDAIVDLRDRRMAARDLKIVYGGLGRRDRDGRGRSCRSSNRPIVGSSVIDAAPVRRQRHLALRACAVPARCTVESYWCHACVGLQRERHWKLPAFTKTVAGGVTA